VTATGSPLPNPVAAAAQSSVSASSKLQTQKTIVAPVQTAALFRPILDEAQKGAKHDERRLSNLNGTSPTEHHMSTTQEVHLPAREPLMREPPNANHLLDEHIVRASTAGEITGLRNRGLDPGDRPLRTKAGYELVAERWRQGTEYGPPGVRIEPDATSYFFRYNDSPRKEHHGKEKD
jgi:hypothetical protein